MNDFNWHNIANEISKQFPGSEELREDRKIIDIPNLIRETGDTIEDSGKKGRVLTFRIRKA